MAIVEPTLMNADRHSQEACTGAAVTEPLAGLLSAVREESIKRRIVQRTGGRIQSLRVETIGSRVVIHGSAPSYYLMQLALRGARDVVGSAAGYEIEFNVEVPSNS